MFCGKWIADGRYGPLVFMIKPWIGILINYNISLWAKSIKHVHYLKKFGIYAPNFGKAYCFELVCVCVGGGGGGGGGSM